MPQTRRTETFPLITHNLVLRVFKPEEFTPDEMVLHFSRLALFERFTGKPVDLEPTRALKDATYGDLAKS